MATYRIGIGTEFKLDGGVGIGTDTAPSGLGDLKVEGTIKTIDLDTTSGIATFARYAGFAPDNLEIGKDGRDTTLTGEHQTTSDIVVGINSTFIVSTGSTVCTSSVESISLTDHFSPPTGGVEDRPEAPVEGTVRFNTDLNTLEFYNGVDWRQFTVNGSSGRGIFGGGQPAIGTGFQDPIQYIQIQSKGNAQFFGELTSTGHGAANVSCCSSSIRGLFMGGSNPNTNYLNVIEYITIASAGNAINFGDLTQRVSYTTSCSSSTRGINMGGYVGTPHPAAHITNTISYVEIMTLGDALDFGDLQVKTYSAAGGSNGTRGMYAAGYIQSSVINSFNIASAGTNASNFGDLIERRYGPSGSSNRTRMVVAGGQNDAVATKSIEFITMASEGNGIDFGNMSVGKVRLCSVADQTRCVFATGDEHPGPAATNIIEFILIASGGSTEDFGDMMTETQYAMGSCSDSHGGLGGY